MRRALPAGLAHADAVLAAGKAAALVRGLATADPALLAWALDDVLHVPFRRSLLPGYDAACAAARAAGAWGATLSGAGSSVVALAPPERAPGVAAAMAGAWRSAGVGAEAWTPAVAGGAVVDAGPLPAARLHVRA
jgi:homoserine kinase